MTSRYELDCTDCSFRTTVAGGFSDALAAARAHWHGRDDAPSAHFVNVRRRR